MIIFLGSSESYIIFSCLSLTLPRFGWIKLRISYIHPFIPYLYIMVYKPIPYNMNWYISVLRPRLHWPVHSVQEIVLFILFHLSASTSLSLSLPISLLISIYIQCKILFYILSKKSPSDTFFLSIFFLKTKTDYFLFQPQSVDQLWSLWSHKYVFIWNKINLEGIIWSTITEIGPFYYHARLVCHHI